MTHDYINNIIQKVLKTNSGSLKTFFLSFWCVSGLVPLVKAQATLGAREIALGQATTALTHSEWSVFANPAMLDRQSGEVSFFGIRYYGLANLTDMAVVATCPTKYGAFGAGIHRYGDELFNETRLRLTYKNAFRGFHYGVAVNYNHVAIGRNYGSAGALGLDVGLAAPITEGLWWGAKATNINQPSYGSTDEELPRNLSIGFSYQLSNIAFFTTDVIKDVDFPISYRSGVEVNIFEAFQARAGMTTNPQTFSFGFGYNNKLWGINIAVQNHENPVLGLSPGVDLNISW